MTEDSETPTPSQTPLLRVHTSATAIPSLRTKPRHRQPPGRKPLGFWWSFDESWTTFVRQKRPKGKPEGTFRYRVDLPPDKNLIQLTDWTSILHFTILFGTTRAPNGEFFWQRGNRSTYDPHQDAGLVANRPHCRVPEIDWHKVASMYDGIEILNYQKFDPSRPYVEWLDIDWDVPSGCAWNTENITLTPTAES